MTSATNAQPVLEHERLSAIDAARGLALLGILLVNIQSFAAPFGDFITPRPESTDLATQVCFYFVKILCEGKFYPLFSLLFGMGLVLQMRSVSARAGEKSFRWLYVRRLVVLLILGFLHAMLLWYGDILFMYAICGFFLLLGSRLSGRTQITIGAAIIGVATLIGAPLTAMMASAAPPAGVAAATPTTSSLSPDQPQSDANQFTEGGQPQAAAPAADRPKDGLDDAAKTSPFFQLINAYRDQRLQGGPEQPLYRELEQRAYHDGPYLEVFLFRAMTWSMFIVFSALGFGWHVLGMFFIGAGLLKIGFFQPERRPLRRKFLFAGFAVALPLLAATTLLVGQSVKPGFLLALAAGVTLMVGGPLLSLAYISGISLAMESGVCVGLLRRLSAVGRLALTNYLTHTLVCTTIFYFYGFGQFGEWTRPQRIGLVVLIFGVQCLLSPLWLKRFRFGPMEWVWRSLTYLKSQPMRRAGVTSA